ncbi:hypothetical protein [Enterococcus nangangensis]|uniref:hypothetical protein n=1 Tax=Enterococcus nangangensis TaxID=2559926 RepID=UPI0010FA14C4|nr:hypothetical protein [Enterococcus nangangensis]
MNKYDIIGLILQILGFIGLSWALWRACKREEDERFAKNALRLKNAALAEEIVRLKKAIKKD